MENSSLRISPVLKSLGSSVCVCVEGSGVGVMVASVEARVREVCRTDMSILECYNQIPFCEKASDWRRNFSGHLRRVPRPLVSNLGHPAAAFG